MKNVDVTLKGGKIHIVIDPNERFGKSKSGKTDIVASTEGATKVPGMEKIYLNLTVYTYPDD